MRLYAIVPAAVALVGAVVMAGSGGSPVAQVVPQAAQLVRSASFGAEEDDVCAPFLDERQEAPPAPVALPTVRYEAVPQEMAVAPAPMIAPPPPPSAKPAMRTQAMPVPGSSMSVMSPGRGLLATEVENRERYAGKEVASVQTVAQAPVSTFAVDVDTGSYSNVRRMLRNGELPPQDAVRTEEMLNYFRYDYPAPQDRSRPFSVTADVTNTPWNPETRLLRVGLRGYDLPRQARPAANLVFLVDVSGSMDEPDKLPLVKCSLALLARQLQPQDRVSIVVYAGAAGVVLEPTSDRRKLIDALSRLQAGGSTAGAEGIQLAYRTARQAMRKDGINRVILATDGDFNVGVTDDKALVDMIEREREAGVTLTTLGFGEGNYNEAMMEQVADHGNGNYAYIDSPREARKVLDQELSSTLFTIAKDVKVQVEFNPAFVSQYRLIGYENRTLAEEDFDNDAVDAGDIGAGHQVTALYEIVPANGRGWQPERRYSANRRPMSGEGNGELAWLRLRYKLPNSSQSRLIEQPLAASLTTSSRPPSGDVAFIAAVAAFGQQLRGDPHLGKFTYADTARLARAAATGKDYWRGEFLDLVRQAEKSSPKVDGRGQGFRRRPRPGGGGERAPPKWTRHRCPC